MTTLIFFSTAPDIWFDDVDDIFIEKAKPTKDEKPSDKLNPLVRPNSFEGYVSFMIHILNVVSTILIKLNLSGLKI